MGHFKLLKMGRLISVSLAGAVVLAGTTLAGWGAGVGLQKKGSGPVWFEGARLIVGDGSAPIENAAFAVEGDRFTWVGKSG